MNTYLSIFVILLLVFFLLFNKSLEHVIFTTNYFIKNYNENNISINKKQKLITKGNMILNYKNHFNNETSVKISDDKYKTSNTLSKHGVPVPKFILWEPHIDKNKNLKKIEMYLKYPVVVKPTFGTQGYGIKTNINSKNEIFKNVVNLLNNKKEVIIEEHKNGDNYRIFVFRGNIIAITKRIFPYVIGDGSNTLKNLIENHTHSTYKTHNIDSQLLKEQKVDLKSIIPKNKKIVTSTVTNYHNGSNIEDIPLSNVHEENIELFKKVNKVIGITLSGIDFITPDISKSYKENEAVVIEVNSDPNFKIHYESSKDKKKLVNKFVSTIFTT